MPHNPPQADLCVVLVETRNPLNIGAIARAMANFGFFDLRVVQPYEAAFREARSAVRAAKILARAREYSSVAEAVADCTLVVGTTAAHHRQPQHRLYRLEQGSRLILKRLRKGRIALLFGSEKRGLSNEDLSHCHWLLTVPTSNYYRSMNLGQAVAVCLYELVRGPAGRTPARPKASSDSRADASPSLNDAQERRVPPAAARATADLLERVTLLLIDALRASGYFSPEPSRAAVEKTRRMVRSLDLTTQHAELWLGMLRQMMWKMAQKSGHRREQAK